MSGTEITCGALRLQGPASTTPQTPAHPVCLPTRLRACYAESGTDTAYAFLTAYARATRCAVRS
eukprot:1074799-Rhodomonas_salina.1